MIESLEKGRQEDGIRSIADKIKGRLRELDQTVENNLGRWAWELLQNAKDSVSENDNKRVSVQIQLSHDNVTFSHNGSFFTEYDIRGLINQISSKEVEVGEQTRNTGRFGTGFLTTHMLSRKVKVAGTLKTDAEQYYKFNFLLDRDGRTAKELMPKVELAWKGFDESITLMIGAYDEDAFNTSFSYQLTTDEQRDIASKGVAEFSKLIPYVLTFIPNIDNVSIVNNMSSPTCISFKSTDTVLDGYISKVEKIENSVKSNIFIMRKSNHEVSIAIEVDATDHGYSVREIKSLPKLFCDFPLIGSEGFHFPMVVNSFLFEPLTERDGIFLKNSTTEEVVENRRLLESAVELYKELVAQVSCKKVFDLYNLALTKIPTTDEKHFDRNWYVNNVQTPIRTFLLSQKIVETNRGGKASLGEVFFPDTDFLKEDRERIWQFASDLNVRNLPVKEHIQKWSSVIWGECKKVNIGVLTQDLKEKSNLTNLMKNTDINNENVFNWLNDILKYIYEKDTILFNQSEIVPNQEGSFRDPKKLFLDEIDDKEIKEIAKLSGDDCYQYLVHDDVFLEHHVANKTLQDLAQSITSLINQDREGDERNLAINKLIKWFESNKDIGGDYFSELYGKKEKLLFDTIEDKESLLSILDSSMDMAEVADLVQEVRKDPDRIKQNLIKAKQLDDLLDEYDADSVEDLKKQIVASGNHLSSIPKAEITQETLASLGVTTPTELKVALRNVNISQNFIHTSEPSLQMFEYAQEIIKRAKDNIIFYLENHPDYDCSDLEELAPTVIGGVLKYGRGVTIVIRPSDNKQVIIYSDSEKASLEHDESAELWVEDGVNDPRLLTLGKVLKNTGITKIPV